jgi:Zn2+/Cd2+-exporting ATPase
MAEEHLSPYVFDEFFASGKEESISPFLTPDSRQWGKNLSLKTSLISAFCLLCSFLLHFSLPDYSHFFLLIVYFLSGTPALIDAIEDIRNFEINIDVLMTLAALLSILIGSGLEGALLLVLFEFSAAMESAVTHKTKGALAHLHQLSPTKACVLENNTLYEKSVKEIPVGAAILVKAGEIVPLDGTVIAGSSFVNLSHLTGESVPVPKEIGDEVQAGARNLDGTLTIHVLRTSSDSTLSKIILLITQAQEAKPQLQKFIDRFDKKYATTIIVLALVFAFTLPWMISSLPYLGIEGSVYRALTFLIAASPCALVIATPTAYLSAISSCARNGILLKGGIVLDALAHCKSIAFDKTGTLTTGRLHCAGIEPLTPQADAFDLEEAISIAASLERHVKHPIADAIIELAQEKGLSFSLLQDFKSIPGSGIEAVIKKEKPTKVHLGHAEYIISKLPEDRHQESRLQKIKNSEKEEYMRTFLLIDEALFVFHFQDEVRKPAKTLIERLHTRLQMDTIMLTGDQAQSAQNVAEQLGISNVFANLRPEDKLNKVAELSKEKGLIMVGDGVNDAPALARASVGISMGKIGSASAVDASDVVFLQDDISQLDWLIRKSHQTLQVVKQNLSLALFVIFFATTPALLGFIPLWLAVVLHEGGTVLVGLNSLRLLKRKNL